MGDTHECPEQVSQKTYYDCGFGGQVTIQKSTDGTWYCGNDDAGLQTIKFCPYCGKKLDV